ncbi:MAG: hypothetical protein JRL30_20420 [Deltaproteobacteria bacterium]|nr:hypothetical protein [Deltaproteobacteria bacterium]
MLSDLIKEHMIRPRNQGIIPGAHGMGEVVVYLEITGRRISNAAFTTHGCWAALALKKAGLPEDKWPCGRLVSQALHRAVRDWQRRQGLKN